MKNFYLSIKKIVDTTIVKKKFIKFKNDKSLLTQCDLIIQKNVVNLIKDYFPRVKQFVCEENFNKGEFGRFNFKEPFAVIDPIDGTENFYANNHMYGTMISINDYNNQIDVLYLPALKTIINRKNINLIKNKPSNSNNLVSISTKCLKYNKFKNSNYRVCGSSAYSFYGILTGKFKSYIYCDGAKIWDYYCGIRLAKIAGLKINFDKNEFNENNPSLKLNFKMKWI
jgi:fructose-1,6-bisphosphatase/inositol monophosphatase family enzyme